MDDPDLQIDDILEHHKKKNKVDGKAKGNRGELMLAKLLTKHFGQTFTRSVGSGNRWGQVSNLPEHAKQVFSGDLVCPEKFQWVIECKDGYDNDVDFSSVFDGGCSRIDEFIKQSLHDAGSSGRKPIIMWKRSRKPWIAIFRQIDLDATCFSHYMRYNDWIVASLDKLLESTDRSVWFKP